MARDLWDAELVEARLLEAGRTLMALQVPGCRPAGFRSGMPDMVRVFEESYGRQSVETRPALPDPRAIAAMDQALSWVSLIPADRTVFRRIVWARLLCRPGQDRPMMGWRQIGVRVGASHEAVRGWHAIALSMIVGRLNLPGFCAAAGGRVGLSGPARDVMERAMRQAAAKAARRSGTRVRELA